MRQYYTVIGERFIIEVVKVNEKDYVIETSATTFVPFLMKDEYEVIEGSLKSNYRRLDKENKILKIRNEKLESQVDEQYSDRHMKKYLQEIKNYEPEVVEVSSIIESYSEFIRVVFGDNFWSTNNQNIIQLPNGIEKDYLKLNLFFKYHKNPDRTSFVVGDSVKVKPKNIDDYLDGEIVGFQGIEPYDPIVHFTNTDGNPMTNSFSSKLLIIK